MTTFNESVHRFSILDSFRRINGFRYWNNCSGGNYIPSFPQLERNETTWPHAT